MYNFIRVVLVLSFFLCFPFVSALNETEIKTRVGQFITGTHENTFSVIFMGNSRVARPTGFAFDGLEEDIFTQGRLAGNGFVVPLYSVGGSSSSDNRVLMNKAYGMTNTPTEWKATDPLSLQHDFVFEGLVLTPGRSVKMGNMQTNNTLLLKDQPLILSISYLAGPYQGQFKITPVDVQGTSTVTYSHPSYIIDAYAPENKVAFQDVVLPPMTNTKRNRAFVLEGVSTNTTIYRTSIYREIRGGVTVSEMAIGGAGYPEQADEKILPAESWRSYVDAHHPDIIFWQFASNENKNVTPLIEATRELIDRVYINNPDSIHILLIDNPTPRSNTETIVNRSIDWAANLSGYRGAIVIDMRPYLLPTFTALGGTCTTTCQLEPYFINSIHENRLGARVVWDAIRDALEVYAFG